MLAGAALILFAVLFLFGRDAGFPAYPFPVSADLESQLESRLASREENVRKNPRDALELAELADLYLARGKARGSAEDFDRAEEAANRSLKISAETGPVARLVLAEVLQARHEFGRAISIASELLKAYPDAPPVLQLLLTCRLALGNLTDAEKLSSRLALLRPSQGTFAYRALVLEAKGRNEEAEHVFREALRRDSFGDTASAAWTRAMFARYFLNLGRLKPAETLLREALRIAPGDTLALSLLARGQVEGREFLRAEKTYQEAFALSRQAQFLAGEARALERRDAARGAALRAQAESLLRSDLGKKGQGHRAELVRLLLEKGGEASSAEAYSLAEAETAERPTGESYLLLAEAAKKSGQLPKAREAVQAALATGFRRAGAFDLAEQVEAALGNQRASALYRGLAEKLRSP